MSGLSQFFSGVQDQAFQEPEKQPGLWQQLRQVPQNNPMGLIQLGMGLLQPGRNTGERLSRGLAGFAQGAQYDKQTKEEKELKKWIETNYPQYAGLNAKAALAMITSQGKDKPRMVKGSDGRNYWAEGPDKGKLVIDGEKVYTNPDDALDRRYKQAQIDQIYGNIDAKAEDREIKKADKEKRSKAGLSKIQHTLSAAKRLLPTRMVEDENGQMVEVPNEDAAGFRGAVGVRMPWDFVPGAKAKDYIANADTLKSMLGFGELQNMRDNSPTGGAVGNLSEKELEGLSRVVASLDRTQSEEGFVKNVNIIVNHLERLEAIQKLDVLGYGTRELSSYSDEELDQLEGLVEFLGL